jgi:hypothetical protein
MKNLSFIKNQNLSYPLNNKQEVIVINPVNFALQNFINHCDSTLSQLNSAHTVEAMDSCSSNYSFFGSLISMASNAKNHAVANELDQLQQEARRINEMFAYNEKFRNCFFSPLSTDFNGMSIRMAEESEHSLFYDWVTSSQYSSIASINTLQQISNTIAKVQFVRNQAMQLISSLVNYVQNPLGNGEFERTRVEMPPYDFA